LGLSKKKRLENPRNIKNPGFWVTVVAQNPGEVLLPSIEVLRADTLPNPDPFLPSRGRGAYFYAYLAPNGAKYA
jgi:hypothetical protein